MILRIISKTRNTRGKEKIESITVPLHDVKISELAFLLSIEQKLNTVSKARFHIEVEHE